MEDADADGHPLRIGSERERGESDGRTGAGADRRAHKRLKTSAGDDDMRRDGYGQETQKRQGGKPKGDNAHGDFQLIIRD